MKLTGHQLEAIKREVEADLRESIIRELNHGASHTDPLSGEYRIIKKIIEHVASGQKLWHW